jgi:hypothetical protein
MVWFSNKHIPESERTGNNSETFSAAGRTITAGLTAADVVSKWTWAVSAGELHANPCLLCEDLPGSVAPR